MKQPVDSRLPRVAFDFIVKAKMDFACFVGSHNNGFLSYR